MMNNTRRVLLFLLIATFLFSINFSANAFSARNIGLGDDFVALTGPDALYGNPAGVNVTPEFVRFELGAGAEVWNSLLRNDYIEEDEKDKLLDRIDNSGWVIRTKSQGGPKLGIGPVTGFLNARSEGIVTLSPDVAELILKGNEIGEEYLLDGSYGVGAGYGEAGANLSITGSQDRWNLEYLYVGATYHRLFGGVISQIEGNGKATLSYHKDEGPDGDFDGDFTLKYLNPDKVNSFGDLASGSAIDLGAHARIDDTYSVGFSVMNIGSLTAPADMTYYQDFEAVEDEDGEEDLESSDEKPLGEELKFVLPRTYRLGGKIDVRDYFVVFTDYSLTNYYFQEGKESVSEHKFAVGSEFDYIKYIPLRTGLNYSTLRNDIEWSGGFGIHLGPVELNVGASDLLGFFNRARGSKAGLNFRLEF